jgi:uncharacterized protein YlxW (UPF0749 family)
MGRNDGSELVKKVLAELARVGAAMMALFTALWFFAAPAAQQFVVQVIEGQHLAAQRDVSELQNDVSEMRKDQLGLDKKLEHLNAQVDSIEQLAREQRALANTILLELKKP